MRRTILLLLSLAASLPLFAGKGKMVVIYNDLPTAGFNDPKPVAPAPGNDATTLGQQRRNVMEAAAALWSRSLDTDVDIRVVTRFVPIGDCTDGAVLAHASPLGWRHSFTNAPMANVWYPIALANKLAGTDLDTNRDDILVEFNESVDNATCLGDSNWYYGLDGREGNHSDMFTVALHELAHGLGVSGAARAPGFREGKPSISDVHTLDVKAGLRWHQMTEEQRRVSHTNTANLVWDGDRVKANTSRYLQANTFLNVSEPAAIARDFEVGQAAFGPVVRETPLSGKIVQALDAANTDGPTTFDGCTPFTNADAIRGNIAMADRGTCRFVVKAQNAQAAGATGLIVVDNSVETCIAPGMAGSAPEVTIPVISVNKADGALIRAQLDAGANVRGFLRNDPSQLAGTSKEGYVRVYAPCTDAPGSSTHHFDTTASPNLLMEPSINTDLLHGLDLTLYQLLDMGWSVPAKSGRRILRR